MILNFRAKVPNVGGWLLLALMPPKRRAPRAQPKFTAVETRPLLSVHGKAALEAERRRLEEEVAAATLRAEQEAAAAEQAQAATQRAEREARDAEEARLQAERDAKLAATAEAERAEVQAEVEAARAEAAVAQERISYLQQTNAELSMRVVTTARARSISPEQAEPPGQHAGATNPKAPVKPVELDSVPRRHALASVSSVAFPAETSPQWVCFVEKRLGTDYSYMWHRSGAWKWATSHGGEQGRILMPDLCHN